jgi:DNA polymerase-3 subunit beta
MKLEVSTPLLQAVCNKAVKAVSTKDIIPSLKNFLFDVTEKNIHIIAGDSATYIEKDIPCNTIQETGKTSVDAKDFTKLINKINSETVILDTGNDNKLTIKAGKSKFSLKTIDPTDYVYPENLVLDVEGVKIVLPELKKALKLGSITVSRNATELYFTGYKIGQCIMTTNRNNLTIYNYSLCNDSKLLTQDLVNLLNDMDGEVVEFGYTDDFIEFKVDGTRILGNLLCGLEFFPEDDILEQFSYESKALVSKKELIPVLDRALIFVQQLGAVELTFDSGVIKSQLVGNTEADTYEEIGYQCQKKIDGVWTESKSLDMTIKVNVGMLQEICSSLDTDTIEFELAGPDSPLLVKSGAYSALMASMAVE